MRRPTDRSDCLDDTQDLSNGVPDFFKKFIYHLIIIGGYLLSTRTFWIVLVAKLLKAPMISTDKTRHSSLLRMLLSIKFTSVDKAVSVPLVLLYACCILEILP